MEVFRNMGLVLAKLNGAHRVWLLLALSILGIWACGGTGTSPPIVLQPTTSPPTDAAPRTEESTTSTLGEPTPSSGSATLEAERAAPGPVSPKGSVPTLDRSSHTVPLMDILFDTFGGTPRFIPLDLADDATIDRLRDVISPIDNPAYGSSGELPWLDDDDLVIGYRAGSRAYAYPVNILEFHEIVNDDLDGTPVLVTYCPLCFSGAVFSRVVGDDELTFGNTSALYMSDLVMYDHQTGSYWFQVGGEAVVGTLSGTRLELLPSTTIKWGEWNRSFPDSEVLTGISQAPAVFGDARYGRGISEGFAERINNRDFVFPVDVRKLDDRLSDGEIVLTVEIDDGIKVFPLGLIGNGVVNDEVAGEPVTVFALKDNRAEAAFSRVLDGRTLNFEFREDGQQFVDQETGSVWDAVGRAVSGPLEGAELHQLNTRRSFWFSVAIAFPGVEVYVP